MHDVIEDLSNKVEKAVEQLGHLQTNIEQMELQKERDNEKIAQLEERLKSIEQERENEKKQYEEKLLQYSNKIGNVIKKLDTVL